MPNFCPVKQHNWLCIFAVPTTELVGDIIHIEEQNCGMENGFVNGHDIYIDHSVSEDVSETTSNHSDLNLVTKKRKNGVFQKIHHTISRLFLAKL